MGFSGALVTGAGLSRWALDFEPVFAGSQESFFRVAAVLCGFVMPDGEREQHQQNQCARELG